MVHGWLKDRIPLPSCAYTAIRSTFKLEHEFNGYDDLQSEDESLQLLIVNTTGISNIFPTPVGLLL